MTAISAEVIESVNQLANTWHAFVKDHGPGDVRDLPGIAIRWADTFSTPPQQELQFMNAWDSTR